MCLFNHPARFLALTLAESVCHVRFHYSVNPTIHTRRRSVWTEVIHYPLAPLPSKSQHIRIGTRRNILALKWKEGKRRKEKGGGGLEATIFIGKLWDGRLIFLNRVLDSVWMEDETMHSFSSWGRVSIVCSIVCSIVSAIIIGNSNRLQAASAWNVTSIRPGSIRDVTLSCINTSQFLVTVRFWDVQTLHKRGGEMKVPLKTP